MAEWYTTAFFFLFFSIMVYLSRLNSVPCLCSRVMWLIHPTCNSRHLLNPHSQAISLPPPPRPFKDNYSSSSPKMVNPLVKSFSNDSWASMVKDRTRMKDGPSSALLRRIFWYSSCLPAQWPGVQGTLLGYHEGWLSEEDRRHLCPIQREYGHLTNQPECVASWLNTSV